MPFSIETVSVNTRRLIGSRKAARENPHRCRAPESLAIAAGFQQALKIDSDVKFEFSQTAYLMANSREDSSIDIPLRILWVSTSIRSSISGFSLSISAECSSTTHEMRASGNGRGSPLMTAEYGRCRQCFRV